MTRVLALEVTNRCNRACLHCLRNQADPPESLPLALAEKLLLQARALGLQAVCLTGGEVALYPHLGELLHLVAAQRFPFTLVTNGYRFETKVLPALLEPAVKARLTSVCLSLDGGTAATHDALRGRGSFAEVVMAAALCRENRLPLSFKSAVTTLNLNELDRLALVGSQLGALEHAFFFPLPTPTLLKKGLLPPPEAMNGIALSIKTELADVFRTQITLEGFFPEGATLDCGLLMPILNVDYQGHLIFCCNLSHVTTGDGRPTKLGAEMVADLKEVPLREAIVRKFRKVTKFLEDRLGAGEEPRGLTNNLCYWCLRYFGKLEWLKNYPDSPWAAGVLGEA